MKTAFHYGTKVGEDQYARFRGARRQSDLLGHQWAVLRWRTVVVTGKGAPLRRRRFVQSVRSESDQRVRWEIMREATSGVLGRVQPLAEVIRAAAVSDPAAGELWNEMEAERLRDVTTLVELLAETGPLRVPVAQAVDLMWAISRSADLYQALACERSWSDEAAFDAVSEAIAFAVLLPVAVAEHRRRSTRVMHPDDAEPGARLG